MQISRKLQRFMLPAAALLFPASAAAGGGECEYSRLRFFIEYNDTAQDVGVQLMLDGEPWLNLAAFSPQGRRLLGVSTKGSFAIQGLTEFFFESSEPSLKTVPLEEFFARFPEGDYEFEGIRTDGCEVEGLDGFTHSIPAGPAIIEPPQGETPPVVDPDAAVIEWEPVTTTIFGDPIEIVGYQLIVEQVEPRRVLIMDLSASTTRCGVPSQFFEQRNTLHKFEVLAIESSGNQTITEAEFITAP